jgi:hypothetical protein
MGEIVDLADERSVLVIEAPLAGPEFAVGMAKVPFADYGRLIARFLEGLRQQPLVGCYSGTRSALRWHDDDPKRTSP